MKQFPIISVLIALSLFFSCSSDKGSESEAYFSSSSEFEISSSGGDTSSSGKEESVSSSSAAVSSSSIAPSSSSAAVSSSSIIPSSSSVAASSSSATVSSSSAAVSSSSIAPSSSSSFEQAAKTPQDLFDKLKGQKALTNGWADRANGGQGLSYANPANFILIDGANSVDKRAKFTDAINNNNSKFIIISGDIDLSDGKINDNDKSYFEQFNSTPPYARINKDISFNLGSNTTIIGINNARLMFGGLTIRNGAQNIIIRNITFWDAHGSTDNDTSKPEYPDSKASATTLQIENNPGGSAIWVDHAKFTDGTCSDLIRNYNHDGAFDIKYGKFITVSWTEFTNHDKVMLVGSSDTYLEPQERQITLHHNYFHGATQRMPRTRGTQMHVYNNYYNDIGTQGNSGYAMGPGVNAQFIVENNYFGNIRSNKVVDWYDNAANPAIMYSAGNNANMPKSPNDKTSGKPWTPAYTYTLESNSGLPTSIPAKAGPILNIEDF